MNEQVKDKLDDLLNDISLNATFINTLTEVASELLERAYDTKLNRVTTEIEKEAVVGYEFKRIHNNVQDLAQLSFRLKAQLDQSLAEAHTLIR